MRFNSRPREGGRQALSAGSRPAGSFNSRPREGGRQEDHSCPCAIWMFQFTPPRGGATPTRCGCVPEQEPVSIHAPARGGDIGILQDEICRMGFNSRPREGGRPTSRLSRTTSPTRFQFTPPRGGATHAGNGIADRDGFNSRPREGGRLPALCL